MPTFKKIPGSEPGMFIAISVVNVVVLKWQRKSCNLGTPKPQPRSLIWPGSELPPMSEKTSLEAGQSKVRLNFYFSGSILDTNTRFLSNITFPVRAQACVEEIMMSSQKLKSINLKVKKPRIFPYYKCRWAFQISTEALNSKAEISKEFVGKWALNLRTSISV